MGKLKYTLDNESGLKIIEVAKNSSSMTEAARKTGINLGSFKRIAKRLGCYKPKVVYRNCPIEDVLKGLQPQLRAQNVKNKLFKKGIKPKICEVCGLGNTWNGRKIVLELHHKNGNPRDHVLENLQILCPNCHSQTETYRGSNKKLK